jgi:hypothetical protein
MNSTIDSLIITIRNHRVILDIDLATLYNVAPKRLNERFASLIKESEESLRLRK